MKIGLVRKKGNDYINTIGQSYNKKVSDLFEEYNDNVIVESGSKYNSCDTIWVDRVRYVFQNNEFCPKLMRNIWLIYKKTEEDMKKSVRHNIDMTPYERCTNLNKWIYYYLKRVRVPEKIIEEIFKITHNMLKVIPGSYKCKYESLYKDYFEPHNLIKLSYFADNKHTILEILKSKRQPQYDACVKYIRECANIYKKMNKEHCTSCDKKDVTCVKTCEELKVFEHAYMLELRDLLNINTGILNLKNTEMDPDIQLELEEELLDEVDGVELDAEGNSDYLINLLQGNITKGAGITAGASAFLFFLFRVNIYFMYKL
ncbi:hypothetical protein PVMG_04510 [Plasmodium vivax Mauritania I]|uniref:Variable surface protein n=1 Tax=Plasmodium vivax Mauritania I TaxID=1035515 RepID=A0A0J9T2P0_PLAVI|nr:hypothetical protein PVMG_04510 [Plasmodium vivax Mauritania I]